MQVKLDEFRMGYIVVPMFEDSSYGITNVIRGDMTDKEWNTWRKVSNTRELSKVIGEYRHANKPASGLSAAIVEYLTNEGIATCLVNSVRPI